MKIAIFDIDGTIFRSSLFIELVEAFLQEKIFPASARKIYINAYKNWLNRKDSYEKYIQAVVIAFNKNIKGVNYSDFKRISDQVVAFHKDRVYQYTRDLVKDLKKKNYYLLAISHSPKRIVDKFAKKIGFDKIYGFMYEYDKKGKITGVAMHKEIISDKAKVLKRAIEKENLTLKGSIGVGDTESDISFLEMVEKPICFNPNQKLFQYAKKKGWKVVVERKDVIYCI